MLVGSAESDYPNASPTIVGGRHPFLGDAPYSCAYAQNYGETAAREAHDGQKWVSVREDWLERLVLRFFEQRIFRPMRPTSSRSSSARTTRPSSGAAQSAAHVEGPNNATR